MLGADMPVDQTRDAKLLPRYVFFVEVAGFTFEFHSLAQVRVALEYFSQKVRPSSRIPFPGGMDHWEAQRCYDQIPMRLLKEPRRVEVVNALTAALEEFAGGME
jgi:hypothetical protein